MLVLLPFPIQILLFAVPHLELSSCLKIFPHIADKILPILEIPSQFTGVGHPSIAFTFSYYIFDVSPLIMCPKNSVSVLTLNSHFFTFVSCNLFRTFLMCFFILRENDNVVKVYHHKIVEEFPQNVTHARFSVQNTLLSIHKACIPL
jgi:hypothetical protein